MKKGALFKTVRVFLVLAAAMGIAAALWILRPKAERQELPENGRLVEVFTARAESLAMTVEAFGTVQPREALNLVAEVRGQIVALGPTFLEGAAVKKGDLLVAIDPRTYELEVQARTVQVRQIQAEQNRVEQEIRNLKASRRITAAEVALAETEFNRLKTLSSRKVVAQTNRDQAEQKYLAGLERLQAIDNQIALTGPTKAQLQAQRDLAGVRQQQAELDLERTRIEAPFDGWVLEKIVEMGQHTAIGQYLGRIYRSGAFDIEVRIPTQDLKWLPVEFADGVLPKVVVTGSEMAGSRTWPGRIARVMAQMDPKTRTLPMVVEVDNPPPMDGHTGNPPRLESGLRPGMFVNISITGRRFDEVFALPRHVVREDDTVYIAMADRLKVQPVSVLRRYKDVVYVDRGLPEGSLVISTPLSDAVDGMRVRIK